MKSIIEWQNGEPINSGLYLVLLNNNDIRINRFTKGSWYYQEDYEIIGFSNVKDIKLIKDETEELRK